MPQKTDSQIIQVQSLADLQEVAQKIIKFAEGLKLWLFEGEMGVGKTTLIKSICKELEVVDNVQSPTFALVNEYQTQKGEVLYHFDFYRLENQMEAFDFGYEEYFDSGNICLIEWGSKITDLIPPKHLKINMSLSTIHTRNIELIKQ